MLHMIKLTVGCPSLAVLAERMAEHRVNGQGVVYTRTMPTKTAELLDGGSLYRVIDGLILCRQPIAGFRKIKRDDGTDGTLIVVTDDIIPVQPRPMRPFQGWRYLKAADAPVDLAPSAETGDISTMPQAMRRELAALGLL